MLIYLILAVEDTQLTRGYLEFIKDYVTAYRNKHFLWSDNFSKEAIWIHNISVLNFPNCCNTFVTWQW